MDQQPFIEPTQTIEWLNKLIMLAQWNRKLPFDTVLLRRHPPLYETFLTRVRASATDNTQLADTFPDVAPYAIPLKKLLEAVAAVPALRELFGSDVDPFKDAPPDHLELLAEVSDVTADSQKMVYSRNGTLEAVIPGMQTLGELDPDPLIVDWLNKFLTLLEMPLAQGEESTAEMLYELATSPHWYIVMASLRASRDYTRDEEPEVADTLKQWNEKLANPALQKVLLNPGHLSRAPKELIRLAWEHSGLFAQARAIIPENAREKNPDDERKQVANSAFLLFEQQFKPYVDDIRSDLKVLATVGSHFVNVRKFAKLDGFVYTWPEIARLGMANYTALKHVEELVLNRSPRPTDADLDAHEARELYTLVDKNERLKRFMRLRPHFRQINENELMQYRPLAPVVVSANRPGVATGVTESVNFVAPQPQPPSPAPPPPTKILTVQTLILERKPDVKPSEQGVTYDFNFSIPGQTVTSTVTFHVEKLLERILAAMGVSSDSGLQEVLKELFAGDPSFAEERIRRGSTELASNLLLPSLQPLSELLATPASARLVVNSPDREIHYLPWEWWPTSRSTLLLSSPDQSVVRSFKAPTQDRPALMFAPLRVMSVIPNPPEGRRFTSDITLKAFDEMKSDPNLRYRPVFREEATLENLQHPLQDFRPHIVHFEGYLDVAGSVPLINDAPRYEGLHLLLSGGRYLDIEDFGAILRASGVEMVVIGRNSVSRIYENPCADAVFLLARQGLSVLAPMRAIDDASATTFTTEFYRAFLQGNKLESALHLARRNLASKGGDWSVFALFTDPDRLQNLELVRESA